MRQTRILMGMPVIVEVVGADQTAPIFDEVFQYFQYVDETFSTYKTTSEISRINRGELALAHASASVREVFALSEETKQLTHGYFDITRADGTIDPSGLVKGWAILRAAQIIKQRGYSNYYVDAGGDIQVSGHNADGQHWRIGIQNPFDQMQVVKVLQMDHGGIATSGTYVRGQHIYNPKKRQESLNDILSLTVIGPDIYEADRFATAAFAMGRQGIAFIEQLPGFEGYQIDRDGQATMTSHFSQYLSSDAQLH